MFAPLTKWLSRKSRTRQAPARTHRPALQVEALEDRRLLSVTHSVAGQVLTVGSSNPNAVLAESVRIIDNGAANGANITLQFGGVTQPIASKITTINVNLGRGNDAVTYDAAGLKQGAVRRVNVNLGDGNDSFSLRSTTGLQQNASFNLNVNGGAGIDSMSLQAVNTFRNLPFTNQRVSLPWTIASGAAFRANLVGGSENDTMRMDHAPVTAGSFPINGLAPASVAANATLAVTMNGEAGNDTIVDTLVASVAQGGRYTTTLLGAAGNDRMSIVGHPQVTTRATWNGSVTLSMDGADGSDTMVADVKANIGSTGVFSAGFRGGLGNDIIDFGYTGKLDGQLFLNVDGGLGDDALAARLIIAANSASTGKVGSAASPATVQGGDGNDNLRYQATSNNPVTFSARMLGGAGTDTGTHSPLTVQAVSTAQGGDIETLLQQNLVA